MILAEFQVGQVLWSLFWFFLFFLWISLVISVFADILRSDDLSGWAKALWSFAIIFLPYLGIFLYLVVRGDAMSARRAREAQAAQDQFDAYVRQTAGAGSAEELARLSELHSSGKLTDDEYARAKAKAIG